MKKSHKNKVIFGIMAAIVLSFVFSGMIQRGWFTTFHLKSSNFLYFESENKTLEDIVIVAIDDKSFKIRNASELGTLKFSKADYAQVIENLEQAGAKVIGVDIILSEISDEMDRKVLVDTLEKYDNIILAAEPKTSQTIGLKPRSDFIEPNPKNLGAILFKPDQDNTVRRQSLVFSDPETPNSFALQIVKKYLDLRDGDSQTTDDGFELMSFSVRVDNKKYSPITIPMAEDGNVMINFFGRPGSYKSISFSDVYENKFTERRTEEGLDLSGKIILIGEMGTGLHDEQYVPISYGQAMSGVEIHANTIQTILNQRFLSEQSQFSLLITIIIAIVIGLTLFLSLNIALSILIFFVGVIVYMVTMWAIFEYGLILNTFYPYLVFATVLVVAYIYRYFTEARALLKTEHAFGKYVSEDVVKRILENPDELKLGGDEKILTVLFSDIIGFTSISEKLKPEALVRQLNEYLDEMSNVILKHHGTIDKFVGDAIIAFWGAPMPQPKHAIRACLTALEYQKRLKELRVNWTKKKKDPFYVRIGIHTGKMIVGNIGSQKRFDYTVIGDAVNLGARLEGANKVFGTEILISGETYRAAEHEIEAREIDLITVKGKTRPVRVYELLDEKGQLSKAKKDLLKEFDKGLKAYQKQDWDEAIKCFEDALKIEKKDGPSLTYLDRCKQLRTEKLPENWDGVFVLTSK